jgi:hypothetical protein
MKAEDGIFANENMFGSDNVFSNQYRHSLNNSGIGHKIALSQPKYIPEDKYRNMKKDFYRYNLLSNRVVSYAKESSTERSTERDPMMSARRQSTIQYPSTFDVVSRARNNQS